jgi:hypothetical protein
LLRSQSKSYAQEVQGDNNIMEVKIAETKEDIDLSELNEDFNFSEDKLECNKV